VKNPGLSGFSSKQLSTLDPNDATPALPGAAVVGHTNALLKCGIQQYFAGIGTEGRRVRGDGEFSSHPGFLFAYRPRAPERRDDIAKGCRPPKDMGPSDNGVVE
jgi:hypothetical protein